MSANAATGTNWDRHGRYDLIGRLRRRVLASIGLSVGWISFVLLYLAFWAQRFSVFQDIVVVVVSLLVLAGGMLAAWVSFGLKFIDHWWD